jgi:signal transduction histidine kinase/ActR/RegA family two-component response regulator
MISPSIPRLELGAELGRGAHSVVLRGLREGREFAVKLPLSSGSEPERDIAFRRFLREAVALARVHDPALPAVMEVGRSGGIPYLVMELASGETLADRLARGPLEEAQVVSLAHQLAGALEAIHAAGLVHRDVKPRNIVFEPSSGRARLVDLGSAALADGSTDAVATRAYAAPELLGREARTADASSDLYSLGRVLLECLRTAPTEPAAAERLVGEGVSLPLANLLVSLVAADPDRRCTSAAQLSRSLDDLCPDPGRSKREISDEKASPARTSARLHGRGAEQERMRRAWADAQRRGGRILLLHGAPGTGKTRLARAFLDDLAGAGVRVLVAACHPRDPRAFSVVRQLVEGYLRQCERLPAPDRARAFGDVRRLAGDLGSLLKLLSPAVARVFHDAPTVPASENAEQAFAEGLADFLERLLREVGPAIVFVDDIQWLDPSSRRVLSRAANHVDSGRSLFLFAARGEGAGPEVARFTEVIAAPIGRIELVPLKDDDVIALACDYLGTPELEANVRQALLWLSDGVPLRALEVLRTLVDEGVLLPYWGRWVLDSSALTQMQLPSGTTSLLRRRIGNLDETTRSVLTTAAVIGMTFEDELLVSSMPAHPEWVTEGLAEAQRAQVIEAAGGETHRFIHHTVRDALLGVCEERTLEEVHQLVAEALDARGADTSASGLRFEIENSGAASEFMKELRPLDTSAVDADPLYRLAFHYAAGVPGRAPVRSAEVNVQAGRAALARFDNERAIGFFESAERALSLTNGILEPQVRLLLAEARLRVGALDDALREFHRVLSDAREPFLQANALSRIAFVRDMQLDSTRAWEALERAFGLLGEELPRESALYALGSVRAWVERQVPMHARRTSTEEGRQRDELLCALYYQTSRVAYSSGKPARIVLSALRALEPAARLGPSPALAKAHLSYAFVLTVLGFSRAGARYLASGEDIGRKLGDPVVYSHALQLHHVIAASAGRVQDSIDAEARCVLEYGHWRELNDYSLGSYSVYALESVRGRDLAAWRWLAHAIDRINRHDGAPVVPEFLLLGARAALAGLGRESDSRALLHRLERATASVPKDSGSYPLVFSPRLKAFTERMDLGPDFEAVVAEFRGLGLNPKRVHLFVLEYFIHLAHARVHTCLRAKPPVRAAALPELERALAELKAAARNIALFEAHAHAIQGYFDFFRGRRDAAGKAFEEAERLGASETAPWVLYAVYRGRAHMLLAEGHAEAAKDQAVLAESVATEHGAVYRAKWVREEFGLRPRRGFDASDLTGSLPSDGEGSDETASIAPGASRARRQLRALLRISQARAQELAPDHQARLVVDELLLALRAERGFLFLSNNIAHAVEPPLEPDQQGDLELVAGRDLAGRDLGEAADYDQGVIRETLAASVEVSERNSLRPRVGTTARFSAISAPLVVDDETVGVVYLDRPLAEGVFSEPDGEVLAALAGQVSVALELTRTLRARERAQESLRNAEKMDAVARLAGGIAHDLNNMLSAIRLATNAMMTMPGAGDIVGEDVRTIQSALQRANELTKQLGTFSRGEFGTPQLVRLGASVERLLPVIAGLVGDNVRVDMRLGTKVAPVLLDPAQVDQVLMNLAMNARDAMPNGGTITFETREITPDEEYLREHPRVEPGLYVCLSVSDTGHGIDEDVRQKIFEPYFTTKRDRGGTGLGLASVYWIVSQRGGHIDVKSTVGVGTTFTLFFPKAEESPPSERKRRQNRSPSATVLIVEEDGAAARELEQTFIELGYRVLGARTGAEALGLVRRRDEEDVDLLITDVVMPGMNGLELARELRKLAPGLGVLFVSGDTSGVLAARGILGGEVEFLPKPIPPEKLVRRARAVLDRKQRSPGG